MPDLRPALARTCDRCLLSGMAMAAPLWKDHPRCSPWPPRRAATDDQGGIGYVGAAHEVAVEAGQRYGRTARAAAGGRAIRFGPAADDDHARPEEPRSVLHPGRVRGRGEGACAR